MAKEIYIDGNGNENLVSGTINNAKLLPIQSGSATNTKDYIDGKTASDIEYSSGVSVYDKINGLDTLDYYMVPNAVADNATAQIPASVWAHRLIIVNVRRYGYFGSMIIRKQNIIEGQLGAGVCIYVSTSAKLFKINETGLFTALSNFGTDGQWVDFIGIF